MALKLVVFGGVGRAQGFGACTPEHLGSGVGFYSERS